MKRIYSWILLASLLAGLFACSDEKKLEPRIVMHPNKSIWKEWKIERTPKGDTLIQGPFKEYFWNGSPAASTIYKDGLKEGSSQAWYDNNAVKWTKVYAAGKPTGTWLLFTPSGKNWMEISFNGQGQIEGKVKVWDRVDAATVHEATYKNGACVEGDCGAVTSPVIPEDLPEDNKAALRKDLEILPEFME